MKLWLDWRNARRKMGMATPARFLLRCSITCSAEKDAWVPFYTYHKIMAGLLDMYVLMGNTDALKVAEGGWRGGRTPTSRASAMISGNGCCATWNMAVCNEALVNLVVLMKQQYIDTAKLFDSEAFSIRWRRAGMNCRGCTRIPMCRR